MRSSYSLVLALFLAASPAVADTAVEARFFDGLARRAFEAGHYRQALDYFLLASAAAPSPRALYNIALCADLTGDDAIAYAYFSEYLGSEDQDSERRHDAEESLRKLQKTLALVEVTSSPPGATIYVDRVELGAYGTTPVTVGMPEGAHQLVLERDGYAPESVGVIAQRGQVGAANVSLTPKLGRLAVRTTPSNARLEFLLDAAPIAAKPLGNGFELPVGKYSVRATAAGYLPTEARAVVREGSPGEIEIVATPLPKPTGRLLVASHAGPAQVWLDGTRVAVTPATLSQTAVGSHEVELRGAAGKVWKRTVIVLEGRASYVEAPW